MLSRYDFLICGQASPTYGFNLTSIIFIPRYLFLFHPLLLSSAHVIRLSVTKSRWHQYVQGFQINFYCLLVIPRDVQYLILHVSGTCTSNFALFHSKQGFNKTKSSFLSIMRLINCEGSRAFTFTLTF